VFQNRSGKGAFSRDVPELLNRKTVRGATVSFRNGSPEPTLINSGEPFFTGFFLFELLFFFLYLVLFFSIAFIMTTVVSDFLKCHPE